MMNMSLRNMAGNVPRLLLITLGIAGLSSLAHATTVPATEWFLQYINTSPSIIFSSFGEAIRYGANDVVPNGDAATNGVGVATTGTQPPTVLA